VRTSIVERIKKCNGLLFGCRAHSEASGRQGRICRSSVERTELPAKNGRDRREFRLHATGQGELPERVRKGAEEAGHGQQGRHQGRLNRRISRHGRKQRRKYIVPSPETLSGTGHFRKKRKLGTMYKGEKATRKRSFISESMQRPCR
jgi:hypothetical protein